MIKLKVINHTHYDGKIVKILCYIEYDMWVNLFPVVVFLKNVLMCFILENDSSTILEKTFVDFFPF